MSIKVNITDEQKKVKLPTGTRLLIRKACIATLKLEGFPDSAEINVTLVNDDMIKEMNKKFRNIDSSTDVLSFALDSVTVEICLRESVLNRNHNITEHFCAGFGICVILAVFTEREGKNIG